MNKTINVYMPSPLASELKQMLKQEIKVFTGREWVLAKDKEGEEELGLEYPEQKMDYMFFTAESLWKYYDHGDYDLDLRMVLQKYGTKETNVIIFPCMACSECNEFVNDTYKDIVTGYCKDDLVYVIDKYFTKLVVTT